MSSMSHLLADLHNTRTLLEAEQERRQRAEAEVDRLRAVLALDGPRTHALLIGEEIAELQGQIASLRTELADQKALFESCNRARQLA
jgi:hypothetical protein